MSKRPSKPAKKTSPTKVKPNMQNTTVSKTSSAPTTVVSKPAPVVSKPASTASKPTTVVSKPAVTTQAKPAQPKVIAKVAAKSTRTSVPKVFVKKEVKKDVKKIKPEKIKMERDSFTMPKEEYAQITMMKARLTALGQPAKKSELLRAGIKLLAAMSDNTLKTTLAKIPVIKTGRPNKKG
jgi:hypothetical protein